MDQLLLVHVAENLLDPPGGLPHDAARLVGVVVDQAAGDLPARFSSTQITILAAHEICRATSRTPTPRRLRPDWLQHTDGTGIDHQATA